MTRTIQAENEACPITSSKQDQGTGKEVLTVRIQKPAQGGIIDADQCQELYRVRMIREELKHQSRIIEVA